MTQINDADFYPHVYRGVAGRATKGGSMALYVVSAFDGRPCYPCALGGGPVQLFPSAVYESEHELLEWGYERTTLPPTTNPHSLGIGLHTRYTGKRSEAYWRRYGVGV